ncbi:MAG: hypothetical protein V4498_08415 [candidate division FCPU426 bacterium]
MEKAFRLPVVMVFIVFLAGCATSLSTYRKFSPMTGGYFEDEKGPDTYEIHFIGGKGDLAERGAAYRCAELTYEKGARYFFVMNAKDTGGFVYGGSTGYGQHAGAYMGSMGYKIRIYKRKPATGTTYDAYAILNKEPVPNSDKPLTVAQRQAGGKIQ